MKKGWKTVATKDGKTQLDEPFFATNPRYVEAHGNWAWQEVAHAEASQGAMRQLPTEVNVILHSTQDNGQPVIGGITDVKFVPYAKYRVTA